MTVVSLSILPSDTILEADIHFLTNSVKFWLTDKNDMLSLVLIIYFWCVRGFYDITQQIYEHMQISEKFWPQVGLTKD